LVRINIEANRSGAQHSLSPLGDMNRRNSYWQLCQSRKTLYIIWCASRDFNPIAIEIAGLSVERQ
jgi:hypothetical protein